VVASDAVHEQCTDDLCEAVHGYPGAMKVIGEIGAGKRREREERQTQCALDVRICDARCLAW
jgi:hypothetical protein